MFSFFPFNKGGLFSFTINNIDGVINNFFENIDQDIFAEFFEDTEESDKEDSLEFISFQTDEDMYVLTIDLKGVDIRQLSIRYDPGIIEVNLNRSEMSTNKFGIRMPVIKHYNKLFKDIEDIDTIRTLKIIDQDKYMLRMPKKYAINNYSNVIDAEYVDIANVDKIEKS